MGPGRSSVLRIRSNPTEVSSSDRTDGGNNSLAVVVHWAAPGEPPFPLDKGKGKINEIRYPSCKTRENSNFLKKNGKTIILVKTQNFYRSRMTKQISPLESSRKI